MVVVVVVMGVCGSGKTTVGKALSEKLGCPFEDGDEWHSPASVSKMSRGIPLTDEDRWPWLEALHGVLCGWVEGEKRGVLACSALRRSYRDVLVGSGTKEGDISGQCVFLLLHGSEEALGERMGRRGGHFMAPSLLRSQLETLEPPSPDERGIFCNISWTVGDIVELALTELGAK